MSATDDGGPATPAAAAGPVGRGELRRTAAMLATYAPECFPADANGQVHFARAMMESAAATIAAYLACERARLRDEFAAAALPFALGIAADRTVGHLAYAIADEMVAAREGGPANG